MIIVVLLFFQSLCLYLQSIVLKVHDKWLNPKHARILFDKEQRRLQLFALKPKHPVPGCSFCSNSPLGYCRHHSPNQPTLRHLKNRLLAKGGSSTSSIASGGGGGDVYLGENNGGGGRSGSGEKVRGSVEGGSISSKPTVTSACEALANYFDSKDPDKICTCLSCSHAVSRTQPRRNRTSWGTRNGTVIWGERVVPPNKDLSRNGRSGEDSGLEVVSTKRRRRRYEKFGGFY